MKRRKLAILGCFMLFVILGSCKQEMTSPERTQPEVNYHTELLLDLSENDPYAPELPAFLAALIPFGASNLYDGWTADDLYGIFCLNMHRSFKDETIQSWYSTQDNRYHVPISAFEALLSRLLLSYDLQALTTLEQYDAGSETITIVQNDIQESTGDITVQVLEIVGPYSPATARFLLEEVEVEYEDQVIYSIIVACTGEKDANRQFHILLTDFGFQIVTVSEFELIGDF